MRKQNFDIGHLSQAIENDLGGFKLFALNNEWVAGVVFENNVIELGDFLATWPIPELKDRRYQSDARHFIREAILSQQIERCGMRRCCSRIRLRGFVDVEQSNRQAPTAEQPPAQQADRATSGNQYPPFFNQTRKLLFVHLSSCCRFRLQF
jgi:hypothetical protein